MAACACCPEDGEACCFSEQEEPVREMPAGIVVSAVDLKAMLAPIRIFLGLQPEPVGFAPFNARDCTKVPATLVVLDLTCIRLI